jgi:phosphoribosylformylglycinamidine cyclo-ligase
MAFLMDKHNTVGIDCVAMCVNDIICSGAEPLFFLDYIACGKNVPEKIAEIVSGVAEGCRQAGASLIGGETAEMPGFYPVDEYDLAGFAVGIVDKKDVIDNSTMKAGDILIGLPSTGVHSNGYSLVRKVFNPSKDNLDQYIEKLGTTLGEELIKPTRIYVKQILELKKNITIKGISHVTGGGFIENIPRMIPEGLCASIEEGTWPVLPIFDLLQETGDVARMSMYNTYNMGIGMVVAVAPDQVDKAIATLEAIGEKSYVIGKIKEGKEIEICLK